MTDQIREKLIYKRKIYRITEEPLEPYFNKYKIERPFEFTRTNCWRSYEGVWKVKYGKLYLANLTAYNEEYTEVGLEILFPGQKEVFAEWYTGDIRLPIDKAEYSSYLPHFFLDTGLFLKFKKGILVSTRLVKSEKI